MHDDLKKIFDDPDSVIAALAEHGLAIYKKKDYNGRRPAQAVKVTEGVRNKVLELYAENPELTMQQIADLVGVNIGRVSEIVSGTK